MVRPLPATRIAPFVMLLSLVSGQACAAKQEPDYRLSIESAMWGAQEILVSKHGIKLVMLEHSFTALTKPPDWKVRIYSTEHKDFCYGHHNTQLSFRIPHNARITPQPAVLRGLPVEKYVLNVRRPYEGNEFDNFMPNTSGVGLDRKKYESKLFVVQEEVFALPTKNPSARKTMHMLYGINGIPLQYHIRLSDGQKHTKIKFKGWKKTTLPSSLFIFPKGLRQVPSLSSIIGNGISGKVMDFSQGWFDTQETGADKKRP